LKGKSSTQIILTAVFAALYSVGVVSLVPISFYLPFQVRVADALLPLAILFGWPAVLGLSLGAFVANIFGGLGPVDMIGGALANFIATFVAWRFVHAKRGRWMLVGVGFEILVVTFVVGTYLSYLLNWPLIAGWTDIFSGSFIAIGILGSLLLFALSKTNLPAMLAAHGLREEYTSKKERPNG